MISGASAQRRSAHRNAPARCAVAIAWEPAAMPAFTPCDAATTPRRRTDHRSCRTSAYPFAPRNVAGRGRYPSSVPATRSDGRHIPARSIASRCRIRTGWALPWCRWPSGCAAWSAMRAVPRSNARGRDADHRPEDRHRAGNRPPDRPAGAERGGGEVDAVPFPKPDHAVIATGCPGGVAPARRVPRRRGNAIRARNWTGSSAAACRAR